MMSDKERDGVVGASEEESVDVCVMVVLRKIMVM